jgi:hypothetical protein
MLAIDSETTGLDLYHTARPFFVTTCNGVENPDYWAWDVDPETRQPTIPDEDLRQVLDEVSSAELLVLQNAKFDVTALTQAAADKGWDFEWPWERTHDTLMMAHLLHSNLKKDLTELGVFYLGWDIKPKEERLRKEVVRARNYARRKLPAWKLAKSGEEGMPSARGKTWKFDMWLPLRLAQELGHPDDHPWWKVLEDYSNADSETTSAIYPVMLKEIRRRKLEDIYEERRKLLPIVYHMERRGVTASGQRFQELRKEYRAESQRLGRVCTNIARSLNYSLRLPKTGNNGSLKGLCFGFKEQYDPEKQERQDRLVDQVHLDKQEPLGCLELAPLKRSKKTGEPSLDKETLATYLALLPERSKARTFVKALKDKRQRDTAITYMEGYSRFWLQWRDEAWIPAYEGAVDERGRGWYILHPRLNPTGTNTLRFSSSHPNEQNISKREGFNLRFGFGPAPGREWYAVDGQNLELRLPTYECREEEFMALFERPNDPPYFGSNHLLIAHVLHPANFEKGIGSDGVLDGRLFKDNFPDTYRRVKAGNFAVQYGAVDRDDGMGTADRTYGIVGAQKMIAARFKKQDALNRYWVQFANKHGYVETMPDHTVDPTRGYPIMCTRTERGNRIKPTVPLNYHVQGTAMWWMSRAMVRCEEQLDQWRREGFDGFITMQVHDELVFDFPKSAVHPKEAKNSKAIAKRARSNWWRIKRLADLMAQGGQDLIPVVPTPVSIEYHPVSWDKGIKL